MHHQLNFLLGDKLIFVQRWMDSTAYASPMFHHFPEDRTSGKDWLKWVDEFLDELFDGRPTFDDIREFLEDNSWEDFIPDKSDIGEVIGAIYDKIEGEIDPSQYIPKKDPQKDRQYRYCRGVGRAYGLWLRQDRCQRSIHRSMDQ